MKIAVIGAGWYGAHVACAAKKAGHDVVVYEEKSEPFRGISGKFGIRLHVGPHYPRSAKTRESCHQGFEEFNNTYPELVVTHDYSIYGLGNKDADNQPSKVDLETFKSVCAESKDCIQLEQPEAWGYANLLTAMNIKEPSIVIGSRLREIFKQRLKDADVRVIYNCAIKKLEKHDDKIAVYVDGGQLETFDYIVNATSFQALLPEQPSLPFNIEVMYQPCVALIYKDKRPTERPFSFIVMDGWFPCVMPYGDPIQQDGKFSRNYMMTHGKWTIMGSFKTVADAKELLNHLDDEFIKANVKTSCESEIKRFWPEFAERFEYVGWQGSVLAKIKTNREFRSAVTFASDNIIYIIPGKVSNVFDVEREVLSFINKQNLIADGNYQYIRDGILHKAMFEITEKIDADAQNTCMLQPYKQLQALVNNKKKDALEDTAGYVPKFFKPLLEKGEVKQPSIAAVQKKEIKIRPMVPLLSHKCDLAKYKRATL